MLRWNYFSLLTREALPGVAELQGDSQEGVAQRFCSWLLSPRSVRWEDFGVLCLVLLAKSPTCV